MISTTKRDIKKRIAYWIIIFIIIVSRKYLVISKPYMWAEDGGVFFQRALDYGIKSLAMPYNGYILLIPQMITWFAVKVSALFGAGVQIVPYIMQYTVLIIDTSILYKICTEQYEWLCRNRIARGVIAALMAFSSGSGAFEVWNTLTNVQWWFGVYIMIVGLDSWHRNEFPKEKELFFLLLIGFSTPFIAVMVFNCFLIVMYRVITHKVCADAIRLIPMILPLLLQIYSVINAGRLGNDASIFESVLMAIKTEFATVPGAILYPGYLRDLSEKYWASPFFRALILGIIIWSALFLIYFKRKRVKIFLYIVIYIFFSLILAYLAAEHELFMYLIWNSSAQRYLFVPEMGFLFLIGYGAYLLLESRLQLIAVIMYVYTMIVGAHNYSINLEQKELDSCADIFAQNSYLYSPQKEAECEIKVAPATWNLYNLHIPINFSEFKISQIENSDGISIEYIGDWFYPDIHSSGIEIKELQSTEIATLSGWCICKKDNCSPSNVLIEVNGNYHAALLSKSYDVDRYLEGNGRYILARFTVWINADEFKKGGNEICIYAFNRQKRYCETHNFTIFCK